MLAASPLYVALLESSGGYPEHLMFSSQRLGGDSFLASPSTFQLPSASTSASPSPVFFPSSLVSNGTPSPVPLHHHHHHHHHHMHRLQHQLQATGLIQPPPSYNSLFAMHNTPTIQLPEADVDVVGLTEDTNEVRITDDDAEDRDQPLDLSVKRRETSPPSSSSTPRPSVIMAGNTSIAHSKPTTNVRRSASSVTPREEPDVSEHFRRSLSGKWPKRSHNDGERSNPFRRKPSGSSTTTLTSSTSIASTSNGASSQIIINHSGSEIEDHFRKALGDAGYEKWKRSKESSTESNR